MNRNKKKRDGGSMLLLDEDQISDKDSSPAGVDKIRKKRDQD